MSIPAPRRLVVTALCRALVLAVPAASTACTIDLGSSAPDPEEDPRPRVAGLVLDADAAAIADVAVVQGGVELGRTDASGRFEVEAQPGDALVLEFHRAGFVRGLERVTVADGATALRVTMVAEAPAIPFDVDAGGRAEGVRGAAIEAPAGAFVDRQGNAIAGMVDVHLTPLNPADAAELAAYPGDGRARTSGGDTVQLETFGVVDVTVRQGDVDLTVADGMGVVVEFPLPDPAPAEPPPTIALWGFDDAAGVWEEEGIATLDADRGVYVGTITHLSPWNCDQPMEATCLKGEVVDAEGDPIAGAYVIASGLDYTGDASATSGEDGSFCVAVRKDSDVNVTVWLPGGASQSRDVTSGSEGTEIPAACDDPRCFDAGAWVFEDAGDTSWDAGACFDESAEARLSMELAGALDEDIDWNGSLWAASCAALAGASGNGQTTLYFQGFDERTTVYVSVEAAGGQTGDGLPATVLVYDALDTEMARWWSAESCTADMTKNEVIAPGLFAVEGRGRCTEPATSLLGDADLEIVGDFAFGGIVFADDIDWQVLYDCCEPYWQ